MYGTEFLQVDNQAYPIRTYPEFEYPLTKEFKDPMLALLETFHKLGPGEQLWLQIIIVPIEQEEWKKKAVHLIRKLIGETQHRGGGLLGGVMKEVGRISQEMSGQVSGTGSVVDAHRSTAPSKPPNLMLYLPPDQKEKLRVVSIQQQQVQNQIEMKRLSIEENKTMIAAESNKEICGRKIALPERGSIQRIIRILVP